MKLKFFCQIIQPDTVILYCIQDLISCKGFQNFIRLMTVYRFLYFFHSWNLIMKITGQHKVTQLQFYCFHLFTRQGNHLLQARRLLQQFMVDAYAKIECERLQYNIRREQKRLRADNHQDLRDTIVNSDGNPNNVGQRVILPSSYYGGPRFPCLKDNKMSCLMYGNLIGDYYAYLSSLI